MNTTRTTTRRHDRRPGALRAGILTGLAGLALAGPLAAVAGADTPPFPDDGPVIVLPEPTVPPTPPVVGPGDIALPDPIIPPVGPGDIALPDPAGDPDPDPGPGDGPDDKAPPVPDQDPEPDPGPFDGPDDLTAETTVPPTVPPEVPEPEVAGATEEAGPREEAAAEELAFTGGDGSLVPIGAGLAAAGALAIGGAAVARRRNAATRSQA